MNDDDKRNDWLKYPPRRRRPPPPPEWRKMARRLLAAKPRCGCGAPATEVDHIKPKCLGGSDDPANAAPICRPCHLKKTAREANHMRWHVHRTPPKKEANQ